jgi:hypothetical protein
MTQHSAESDIVARMADHYARQIAWVESAIHALEHLNAMPPDADLDQVAQDDARRVAELKSLEAEFFALKKEWDATPAFLPDERNAIRTLVVRFKTLSTEFHQKLETLLGKFSTAGNAVHEELGTLRKARDVMQKFAAGPRSGGGIVDRRV